MCLNPPAAGPSPTPCLPEGQDKSPAHGIAAGRRAIAAPSASARGRASCPRQLGRVRAFLAADWPAGLRVREAPVPAPAPEAAVLHNDEVPRGCGERARLASGGAALSRGSSASAAMAQEGAAGTMKKQQSGNDGRTPEPASLQQRGRAVGRLAEYVGSFSIEDVELQQKAQTVDAWLQGLKALLMAHALKRILYSTWRPSDCQFAFVARNPRSPPSRLFCHLFVGSQPSEVQTLHLLLCRSFQLCYLLMHPEEQDWPPSGPTPRELGKLPGSLPESRVVWESLSPEDISQNVNALVSFRRLPCPADFGSSVSVRERLDLEERGSLATSRPGNPFCSPILVRKKAIRSKILRSGAYRGCTFEAQWQQCVREMFHTSCDGQGSRGNLTENDSSLMENVWSFAGIDRDVGAALLRSDVLGAFLLWAEPGTPNQWCLTVKTRCGVIPYQIYRSQLGKFSIEHLNVEFPSMEALLDNYSGIQGGLFCSLAAGRVNHCYEQQDFLAENDWYEERSDRQASWLGGASKSLVVQQEQG
ncbi:hypothetical protein lerEdw1_003194 [Lerista edwardsae]|nr:hypothetical protein lerEdw1_003194 [Lerista edwardsae]